MATAEGSARGRRTRGWRLVGLALLVLLGLLYVFGAVSDLTADADRGLPTDHAGTFKALTGTGFPQLAAATPGVTSYTTLLERGYALHELTFAALFLVLLLVPFRRGQRWAWWTAWIPMIANLGYTFTFGLHDPTILGRSLIADIALPILLLAHIPVFFPSTRPGPATAPSPSPTT